MNDRRLLSGAGSYVDDIELPGMRHAAIVRSQAAHGMIRSFEPAETDSGAVTLGPAELARHIRGELPVLWTLGDQDQRHTPVVDDHLRYVGQPVGIVVARSRYSAEDAAEMTVVEVDDLEPVVGIDAALAPDAALLYPDRGSNVLATFEAGDAAEHTAQVFAAADRTLSMSLRIGRLHGLPMETRGIVAAPRSDGGVTIHISTQAPYAIRDAVCDVLGFAQSKVRVVAPDVGGGFGLKDHIYEDEMMAVIAAIELGHPVKWIGDRLESLTTTTHARDEHHELEVAFDDDGTLRGLRIGSRRDVGARLAIFGGGPLFTELGVVPGPYKWDAVRGVGELVATNTMSTGAYRGFGQTQAGLLRERAVEAVAAELDRDPVELRAQNMIRADELPYQIRTFIEFDNGDYEAALRRADELIKAAPAPADDGRARGVGYCSYVQMAGIGPSNANEFIGLSIGGFESAAVRMEPDGGVRVATGISPHGQGAETTIPQLVADELGVELAAVELIHGDTDTTPYSAYGTAASRSIALGGGSAVVASQQLADKIRAIAAEMLEASPADIELVDGTARVVGSEISVTLAEVAKRAWQGFRLPEGVEPGLHSSYSYDPPSATFSYATHACRVAVDEATGEVEVEQYVVVHDCGTIVNPTVVEGQIHGGVAQGLGAALMEEVVYDEYGQLQTSTLLDYHAPVGESIPDITIEHIEIPSPYTPGGMKGMGEGGTNGSYAAVVNAVCAALPQVDWSTLSTPLTPSRIWERLREGG